MMKAHLVTECVSDQKIVNSFQLVFYGPSLKVLMYIYEPY